MTHKQLKDKYPDKYFGVINITRNADQRGNYSKEAEVIDMGWEFFLNHSCDEWTIGDFENAKEFNKSLIEALEFVKNNP